MRPLPEDEEIGLRFFNGLVLSGWVVAAIAAVPAWAGQAPDRQTAAHRWSEWGEASWYGKYHAGRRTTSGERFDPRKMTAAHPTLPLGTWVKVTDDATGKSVTVRINDREPPHGVRAIDLSQGAAAKLGIVSRGLADVTIEVAEAPPGK
jgi:rare lipoprotein A